MTDKISAGTHAAQLRRLRAICLALPETTERLSHSAPTFFCAGQKAYLNAWLEGHHDHTFPHLWCAAPIGAQEVLVGADPRYFRPPYVGHRGWIGVRLDGPVDWDEIADLCEDAYRTVAPRRLLALLDSPGDGP
ncbi:MAG: MmcQ/YjbR family DNA-binding protein [Acidimicrobiales bacterium]